MSKTRDTGFINNILKYDNDGNVSVVSGSTTLLFISSSGAIITTGIISGSNALSASYAVSASNSLAAQTASYVLNAQSASYVLNAQSASYVLTAQTASFVANAQSASNAVAAQTASYVLNAVSSSFASTASSADDLLVRGTLTAQTLVVQTITSSVDFVTGSTRFGSILGNTHVFSGSVTMNPNGLFVSSSGVVGIGTTSPTTNLHIISTGTGTEVETLRLDMNTSTGPFSAGLNFRFGGVNGATIYGVGENGSTGASSMRFYTHNGTSSAERMRITSTGAVTFSSTVDGTIFNSTSNAFRFSGNNAISLVSLNAQNVVKINAAGYWGTQLVGANDQGILIDNTGKVGVGVNVLSGWDTTLKPIEIGCSGSFYAGFNGLPLIYMGANAYYNEGWKYASSNTSYRPLLADMGNGSFHFLNAQTGSAGSAISWTTLMKLDNSGNVGIGTTSPSSKLHIFSSTSGVSHRIESTATNGESSINFYGKNSSGTVRSFAIKYDNADIVRFGTADAISMRFETSDVARLTIASNGAATFSSSVTATQFAAGSASATYPFNSISAAGTQALLNSTRTGGGGIILQNNSADSVYLGTANWAGVSGFGTSTTDICLAAAANSSAIVFATGTSSTERMRITSGGSVLMGIGTNSASARLALDAIGMAVYDGGNYRQCYMNGNTMAWFNGSNQGTLSSAGVWTDASDISIKKDIKDIEYGLDAVLKLKPRSYKMKQDDLEQIGFIAQEVEEVIKELVTTDNKDMKGLSYGQLTAVLTKAIQEQQAQIEELKAIING
jgi:hypothetical protein